MSHEELRRSLASYVFGALGPEERRALHAHMAGCPGCRDELASYAGLPGLLSRLELSEATGASLLPPASLLPSVLAAVESERISALRSCPAAHRCQSAPSSYTGLYRAVRQLPGGP